MKLQTVHLRIGDAATKAATAAYVSVVDADGHSHAPFGRHADVPMGPGAAVGGSVVAEDGVWHVVDGACEIAVPPGNLRVRVRKGFEWRPLDVETTLPAGKLSLRLDIERWTDRHAEGWLAGDVAAYDMTPHAALVEAAAADLDRVELLVRDGLANVDAFSGQHPALARPGHAVAVNTCNAGATGRLLLLHTHRPVYPLTFAEGERWSLLDWCRQAHRKRGLVVADDWFERRTPELDDDAFLRETDALRYRPSADLGAWDALLARGLRLPLVAGSDKASNRQFLGAWRTYAWTPDPTTADAWVEALRAGRTYCTRGPLFRVRRDGETVRVEAEALAPLARLEIVADGAPLAVASGPATSLVVQATIARNRAVTARCHDADGVAAVASPALFRGPA